MRCSRMPSYSSLQKGFSSIPTKLLRALMRQMESNDDIMLKNWPPPCASINNEMVSTCPRDGHESPRKRGLQQTRATLGSRSFTLLHGGQSILCPCILTEV
ncbi:unnamed protein product [Prorocentrum cordatum]|uniref:Uncharacterized protein n=1 Tax=Prorocentrum cordatum TaxID=2364126 RepID=A0ABN9TB49_9DINO|nr:unnamed protein product [Polarella glacialis]